jgi:hypothetical protein
VDADLPPLHAEHDKIEARAVAATASASPRSVDAMLAYAETENLIRENLNVVLALIDALGGKPTGRRGDRKRDGPRTPSDIRGRSPGRLALC